METMERQHQTTKKLLKEVQGLKQEIHTLTNQEVVRKVSDKNAEMTIRKVVGKFHRGENISILDLIERTRLPVDQIDRIMNILEKEGVVTERD